MSFITPEMEGHVECIAFWDISHAVCCDVYCTLMQIQKVIQVFTHIEHLHQFKHYRLQQKKK